MVGLIDPSTGQVYDGFAVPRREPHPYAEQGFVKMVQPQLRAMACDPDLGGEALKVFMMIVSQLAFGGVTAINQAALARDLGIARPSVVRAVRLLIDKGVLLRDDMAGPGRPRGFALNPMYGYKGNAKDLKAAQQKHLRLVHVSAVPEGDPISA